MLRAARATRLVVTVEEHSLCGGLGARCAQVLMEAGVHVGFKMVGIPDEETVTGSQDEIFNHYGINPQGLAQTAREYLNAQ